MQRTKRNPDGNRQNAIKSPSSRQTTVTKITKLVLKPKPTATKAVAKSKFTFTTNKYSPKQRVVSTTTASSVVRRSIMTNESTYRISNYGKKSEPGTVVRMNKRKLSHSPVDSTQVNGNPANGAGPVDVQMEFSKNREIREKCTEEFQAYLNETIIEAFSPKSKKYLGSNGGESQPEVANGKVSSRDVVNPVLHEITSTIVNSLEVKPQQNQKSHRQLPSSKLMRAKTEELKSRIAVSPKSPRKGSHDVELDGKCKEKSYYPIKARQFIREQQEKRKEQTKEAARGQIQKDEIKKRLAALQKNSLKIVGANIKRARKKSIGDGCAKENDRRDEDVHDWGELDEWVSVVLGN